jgi:Mg2+ and Co2+ transporter CorA
VTKVKTPSFILAHRLRPKLGPYQKYIEALSGSNPGLNKADPNNKDDPLRKGNAGVYLLDSPAFGQPDYAKQEFVSAATLQKHFDESTHDHKRRRIYIMEGLAPDYVATIGGHFFMEPTFFQRQERTCVWSNDFTPVSDALPQPSLLNPKRSFHLQYCELRQFNKALENTYYFCKRTRRHVGMTAPRPKEKSTTGILRRKISWWCRETSNGGWDGKITGTFCLIELIIIVVILCDPQLVELSPLPKEVFEGRLREIENIQHNLKNSAFQDGYREFVPSNSFDSPPTELETVLKGVTRTAHSHESVRQDLIYYYTHHSSRFTEEEWKSPQTSAIFLKKIVAAHYLQLVDYIKVMLPSLEVRLTTAWVEEKDQWKSLQTISRRCGNYRDDIEDNLLSLGYPLDGKMDEVTKATNLGWKDCERDLQYVYFRLKILKERADSLTTSMTGLASIAGNRQNLEEAKRVKRLNLLALLFIPLAYTSSLFSMQDNYAPNKKKFWVYWVSAIGAVWVTSVITFILNRALDDEANWKLARVKWLKFLSGDEKTGPHERKKTTTGLYG